MQKEEIIRKLYRGELEIEQAQLVMGSPYQKKQFEFTDMVESLEATLDEDSKNRLEELVNLWSELIAMSNEEYFATGFKLGAKLMVEVLGDGNSTDTES